VAAPRPVDTFGGKTVIEGIYSYNRTIGGGCLVLTSGQPPVTFPADPTLYRQWMRHELHLALLRRFVSGTRRVQAGRTAGRRLECCYGRR
jgi:hypothetical protein